MKRHLVPPQIAVLFTPFVSFLGIGRMCSRCRRDLFSRWPHPARHRLVSVAPLDGSDGQISPDKNVNFRDTTAAFTPFPRTQGFVHVVQTHPETRPCMLFLFVGSSLCTPASFGRSLTVPPLPSASTCANVKITFAGFTYRGLSPHKFTPMPGVHNFVKRSRGDTWCRLLQALWPRATYDPVRRE